MSDVRSLPANMHYGVGDSAKRTFKLAFKGVPAQKAWSQIADSRKELIHNDGVALEDASYAITSNEITALQNMIEHVLRWETTSGTLAVKNIGEGAISHQYFYWNDVIAPQYTMSFERGVVVSTKKTSATVNLQGIHYDTYVDLVTLDADRNTNVIVKLKA